MPDDQRDDLSWLRSWKKRGWDEWMLAGLDAFEPLAPLGAQILRVAQPIVGGWVNPGRLEMLARALETPEGIARIRHYLHDEPLE